jgi:hypothetical protein
MDPMASPVRVSARPRSGRRTACPSKRLTKRRRPVLSAVANTSCFRKSDSAYCRTSASDRYRDRKSRAKPGMGT